MSKYLMAFLTVVLVTFGIYSFTVDINTAADTKNGQYASYLTAATHDAAKEIQSSTTGQVTMGTASDRKRVSNAFFNSLKLDFGYTTEEDMQKLHVYVPVLALIDSDGYYICFNQKYADEHAVSSVTESITSINTWTKQNDKYMVRYYLGSNVDVTDKSNLAKSYSGTYDVVYKEMTDAGVSASDISEFGLTGNEDDFRTVQRSVIIEELQEKIEYYINKNNDFAAEYTPSYTFTMPQTNKDDWTRLIENPTCIAFLQGIRVSNGSDYLNIYSMGGGEVKKQSVVGVANNDDETKTYNTGGVTKTDTGYVPTAKDAAKNASSSDTFVDQEPTTVVEKVAHKHWGSSLITRSSDEIGCYTKPVYHTHTTECYTRYNHRHFDSAGNELIEDVDWISVDGKYYDKDDNEIPASRAIKTGDNVSSDYETKKNCFTEKILHVHTDDCYKIVYHQHTDACYKTTVISNENGNKVTSRVLSCGYYAYDPDTDTLLGLTSEEQKLIDEGTLDRQYFIDKAVESKKLTCGKEEGAIDGYRRACKRSDGAFESQKLTCGLHSLTDDDIAGDESKMTVADIDHYAIGCGYKEGQMITKEEARTANKPE